MAIGQWLETDSSSRAKIRVAELGQVEIEPNTSIRLAQVRPTEHRMTLRRGVIHALIWAPPRHFFVDTPSAQAIDLGCAYTLRVSDDGSGLLQVTIGWVAFEHEGLESFVPADAECRTLPGRGPGTPYKGDATVRLKRALESYDFGPRDHQTGQDLLATISSEARPEDALTLWHLLSRTEPELRPVIFDRLAQLVPPPQGITRQGILAGNRTMLDLWWNQFGYGDAAWWRNWKADFPQAVK